MLNDHEDDSLTEARIGATTDDQIATINARLDAGSRRMKKMQEQLAANTEELAANTEITTEIRDLMKAAKFGGRLMNWIGVAAAWIAKLAVAGSAIYYAIKHGGPPPK